MKCRLSAKHKLKIAKNLNLKAMRKILLTCLLLLPVVVAKAQIGKTLDEVKKKLGEPSQSFFTDRGTYCLEYGNLTSIVDGLPINGAYFYFNSDSLDSKCTLILKVFTNNHLPAITNLLSNLFVRIGNLDWLDYENGFHHRIVIMNSVVFVLHSELLVEQKN